MASITYQKDLANGDVAIAVVNLSDNSATYTISMTDYDALDPSTSYSVRDLIGQKDAGTLSASSSLTGSLAAHRHLCRKAEKSSKPVLLLSSKNFLILGINTFRGYQCQE